MSLMLTLVAALLFAVGWTAGKLSLLALWCWSAVAVGWDAARDRSELVDAPVGVR